MRYLNRNLIPKELGKGQTIVSAKRCYMDLSAMARSVGTSQNRCSSFIIAENVPHFFYNIDAFYPITPELLDTTQEQGWKPKIEFRGLTAMETPASIQELIATVALGMQQGQIETNHTVVDVYHGVQGITSDGVKDLINNSLLAFYAVDEEWRTEVNRLIARYLTIDWQGQPTSVEIIHFKDLIDKYSGRADKYKRDQRPSSRSRSRSRPKPIYESRKTKKPLVKTKEERIARIRLIAEGVRAFREAHKDEYANLDSETIRGDEETRMAKDLQTDLDEDDAPEGYVTMDKSEIEDIKVADLEERAEE